MSAHLSRLIAFFFMLFCSSIASAEDYNNPYNFSVEVGGGILFAPRMKADNGTKDVWTNHNFGGFVKGMSFKLRGEYYIPSTSFSIKGGIENESFQIQDSYVSEPLKQIMLGGRYYPIGMLKVFRPFVGFDTFYNIGRKRTEDFVSQSEGAYLPGYSQHSILQYPRFSVSPVLGTDIAMTKSISVGLEYGYRLGLSSKVQTNVQAKKTVPPTVFSAPLHRHSIAVTLKVSFPFTFEDVDLFTLFGLFDYKRVKDKIRY